MGYYQCICLLNGNTEEELAYFGSSYTTYKLFSDVINENVPSGRCHSAHDREHYEFLGTLPTDVLIDIMGILQKWFDGSGIPKKYKDKNSYQTSKGDEYVYIDSLITSLTDVLKIRGIKGGALFYRANW